MATDATITARACGFEVELCEGLIEAGEWAARLVGSKFAVKWDRVRGLTEWLTEDEETTQALEDALIVEINQKADALRREIAKRESEVETWSYEWWQLDDVRDNLRAVELINVSDAKYRAASTRVHSRLAKTTLERAASVLADVA